MNFEHLLASNFTETLFLKCSNADKILYDLSNVYFRQIFSKILEKKCYFLNNIFRKFEIVVYFALLLHGVERNTILNFDSKTESVKSKILKIALHGGSEENKEKWDEPFSRAGATRKKVGLRAPPPFPTRFSRTEGASVVVTASVSDLSTLV